MVIMVDYRKIFLIAVVLAIAIIVPIVLILCKKKSKGKNISKYPTEPPKESPYISVEYIKGSSVLSDGKCGWLEVEYGFGGKETIELKFSKNSSTVYYIPLQVGSYRITYSSKSKASMAAEQVLKTINESSGAMGSFANSVFDAGVGKGQLSSVTVNVDADFVMKLGCTTDGFNGSCVILS